MTVAPGDENGTSRSNDTYFTKMVSTLLLLATTAPWLGADGTPLPFASDEALLEFLATAPVIERKVLEGSRNLPVKLTLRQSGIEAHAIFRTVDKRRKSARVGDVTIRDYHDGFVFECAAYRLAKLLAIDNVPPCVLRTIDGQQGSVQLWIQQATTEYQNRYDADGPTASVRRPAEFRKMHVFDALIHNFDRHPGNVLVDEDDRIWFIDHTRSFRLYTDAPLDNVDSCSPELHDSLVSLDRDTVEAALRPFLSMRHVDAVWRRRGQLIRHLGCRDNASTGDGVPNPHEVSTHDELDRVVVETTRGQSFDYP